MDEDALFKVFCFPHAGGVSQSFEGWIPDLSSQRVALIPVEYPGHGKRRAEQLVFEMQNLINDLIRGVLEELDRPFIFFGHSLGGLVAYAMCRELESRNLPLPSSVIISSVAPFVEPGPDSKLSDLNDTEFVLQCLSRGWFPREATQNPDLVQIMLAPLRADIQIYESFISSPSALKSLKVPIVAIGGSEDISVSIQSLSIWQTISDEKRFRRHVVPGGGHFHTQTHSQDSITTIVHECQAALVGRPPSISMGRYVSYPDLEAKCIHELFEEQARKSPDALAVVDARLGRLTFRDMTFRIDLLARLLQFGGVGTGMDGIVGIFAYPSADFFIAMLAVLQVGGGFLPFYTNYTSELVRDLVDQANVKFMLVDASEQEKVPESLRGKSFAFEDHWLDRLINMKLPPLQEVKVSPSSVAMLAMTSGSSGKPKAIIVSHHSTVLCFAVRWHMFPLQEEEVIASNIFFVWEVFRGPLRGRPVYVIPDDVLIDPKRLVKFLSDIRATQLVVTAQLTQNILNYPGLDLKTELASIKYWMLCGEVCTRAMALQWFDRLLPAAELWNYYGSWEALDITYVRLSPPSNDTSLSASRFACCGPPMHNVGVFVLDRGNRPVPQGVLGDVYIGGLALADGYLGDPERNAAAFRPNPFTEIEPGFVSPVPIDIPAAPHVGSRIGRLYYTGDKGRILHDGQLEIAGRVDNIIKIRGFKVGLSYVENAIRDLEGVGAVCVMPILDAISQQPVSLAAYIVSERGLPSTDQCERFLRQIRTKIPTYAVPSVIIGMQSFPTRPGNGKLDRKLLPPPEQAERLRDIVVVKATRATKYQAQPAGPANSLEKAIQEAWQSILGSDTSFGLTDNFFEVGGHSLLASAIVGKLTASFGLKISVIDFYSNPTIASLAGYIRTKMNFLSSSRLSTRHHRRICPKLPNENIAVIGLAGNFPGAADITAFWSNLQNGVDSLRKFNVEELRTRGVPEEVLTHPYFVPAGQAVDHPDHFDAYFWGIGADEAKCMDPQQRMFLQCAWHAMENAGYAPRSGSEFNTGVFAACGIDGYLINHLDGGAPLRDLSKPDVILRTEIGNEKDYIATRVSYQLDLGGPSVTVNSACSSGLVAIAQASQAILAGQCDVAIAGAASITFPNFGYLYSEGLVGSKDGRVCPFDVEASGTLFGDSVGAVVLKRLDNAIEDGDHIWAIVRGTAVTNDGRQKAGYAAPSANAQQRAIEAALTAASVAADSVSYVECHATATHVGDAIEIAGLTNAFRNHSGANSCALGSVKGNIGHANCAAGITGFIKAVLCLRHEKLVPTVNFSRINDKIDLTSTPFFVNTEFVEWKRRHAKNGSVIPLRAGVSSFGVGGTNAHIVLEEAPPRAHEFTEVKEISDNHAALSEQILLFSAKTVKSLVLTVRKYADFLESKQTPNLVDVAYTLAIGREAFAYRYAITAQSKAEAVATLKHARALSELPCLKVDALASQQTVFVFSGQGSQYVGMGRQLYETELTFRKHIDHCVSFIDPLLSAHGVTDSGLLSCMFADEKALARPAILQPAIFVIEYSMASTLMEYGVRPMALCGHSIGEYVAACFAGVFSLETALRLIACRGLYTEQLAAEGAMLSVKMSESELNDLLFSHPGVSVAARNAPHNFVLSGSVDLMHTVLNTLSSQGKHASVVHVNHAFHSSHMVAAASKLEEFVATLQLSAPSIPITSNVTGGWLGDEVLTPSYWGAHMRGTVLFSENIAHVMNWSPATIVEVGPGDAMSKLIQKHVNVQGASAKPNILQSMRHAKAISDSDLTILNKLLAGLWARGVDVDWKALHSKRGGPCLRVPVPGYSFEPTSYWSNPRASIYVNGSQPSNIAPQPIASSESKYLVPLNSIPPKSHKTMIVMLCFPYAGGSSRVFAPWSAAAQAHGNIHIVAVELPGRGSRAEDRQPSDSHEDQSEIDAIAQAIFDYMQTMPRSASLMLCGLSMGALVALRVSQRLFHLGSRISAINIAGRAPPFDVRTSSDVKENDLLQYSLVAPELMSSPTWIEHFRPLLLRDLEFDARLATSMASVQINPETDVLVLCGLDDKSFPWYTAHYYQRIGGKSFKIVCFPGGHEFLRDRWSDIFASCLQQQGYVQNSGTRDKTSHLFEVKWQTCGMLDDSSRTIESSVWSPLVIELSDEPIDLDAKVLKAIQEQKLVVLRIRDSSGNARSGLANVDFQVSQCWSFVAFSQRLIHANIRAKVILLFDNVQASAMVLGASRCLSLECPELQTQRVHYSPGLDATTLPSSLKVVVSQFHQEADIYIDDDLIKVKRAVARNVASPLVRRVLRRAGIYIVTGGTGGIGTELVNWLIDVQLVESSSIVLLTRNSNAHFRNVHVIEIDASDSASVSKSVELQQLASRGVAGIFHLAGLLDDGMIINMSRDRINLVTQPKVNFFHSLLRACAEHSWRPKWIIAFSSLTSLLGYSGQTNYAAANSVLDQFSDCSAAVSANPPIISINWGPWAEVGMARIGTRAYNQSLKGGEVPLSTSDAFFALEAIIGYARDCGGQSMQFGVCHTVWSKSVWKGHALISQLPDAVLPIAITMETPEPSPIPSKFLQTFNPDPNTVDVKMSKDAVRIFLETRLSSWIPSETLAALGVDSLDEVQMRNEFQREFNTSVPLSTFVVPNQTLEELWHKLRNHLSHSI